MKAVILAAGNGKRMYPLTLTTPKVLTTVLNKTILEYLVESLEDFVDEIVLVIGDPKENELQQKIVDFVEGREWPVKFSFAIQKEQKGTAHALYVAKDYLDSDFILINGDDIYSKEDIGSLVKSGLSVLGVEVDDPEKWGILQADDNGNLKEIIEKPKEFVGNLAGIGAFLFSPDIFDLFDQIEVTERGELELPDLVNLLASKKSVKVVKSDGSWTPVGYPWHILDANEKFLDKIEFDNKGEIEDGVQIHGRVKLGKGSIIKSGTYIEGDVIIGENCVVGPMAYIRGLTVIGNDCKIGNFVEVKNSVVMNGSKIPHLSYLGDGIVGKNVNFGCGAKVANLRHDSKTVQTMLKGELVDTGRRKFSTVIGDGVKLGIDTKIFPGRKIFPGLSTRPGQIVTEDVMEG